MAAGAIKGSSSGCQAPVSSGCQAPVADIGRASYTSSGCQAPVADIGRASYTGAALYFDKKSLAQAEGKLNNR